MARGALHEDLARNEPIKTASERNFGLTIGAILILLGLRRLWTASPDAPYALVLGAALIVLAVLAPRSLALPNRLWSRFGLILGRIVTPIVMGLLFFLVMTPIALAMRLAGRRPLRLAFEPASASYWLRREPPGPTPETMTRQF